MARVNRSWDLGIERRWGRLCFRLRRLIRLLAIAYSGYDGFISYARKESESYSDELWRQLEAHRLIVCRDQSDMHPGDNLPLTLWICVRRSSYLFLLDTPQARRSKYIRQEVEAALQCGRRIVRILFSPAAESDAEWHLLADFKQKLENTIWVDDYCDPRVAVPRKATVKKLVEAHHAMRVRRRFWRAVIASSAAIGSYLGVLWLATEARERAADVLSQYRDDTVSLSEANASARRLLEWWAYPVDHLFAADEHWQLADLALSTVLKAVPSRTLPGARVQEGICDTRRSPACVARWSPAGLTAHIRNHVEVQVRGKGWQSAWTPMDDNARRQFDGVALGASRVATFTSGAITLFQWGENDERLTEVNRYSLDGIQEVRFSKDGTVLAVLWEPAGQPLRLSTFEVGAGGALQEANLAASCPPGDASDCEIRLHPVSGGFIAGVGDLEQEFELRPIAPARTYTTSPETRVAGAMQTDAGVAFWTETGVGWACVDGQRCEPAVILDDDGVARLYFRAMALTREGSGQSAEVSALVATNMDLRVCRRPRNGRGRLSERPAAGRAPATEQGSWDCEILTPAAETHFISDGHRPELVGPRSVPPTLSVAAVDVPPVLAPAEVIAAAAGTWLQVTSLGDLRLWRRDVTSGEHVTFDRVGRQATPVSAAALTPDGKTMAVAVTAGEPIIYIASESRMPVSRRTWRRLRAGGQVLALRFADDGSQLIAVERWNRGVIVKAIYPLTAARMAAAIKRRG